MLDIRSAEIAARALAGKQGLTVQFHGLEKDVFYTAGTVLYVPCPDPAWSVGSLEYSRWMNGLAHEIGHHAPEARDIFDILKKHDIDTGTAFGAGLNIIDDVRNDRIRTTAYPGTVGDNVAVWRDLMLTKLPLQYPTVPPEKGPQAVAVVMAAACHVRAQQDARLEAALSGMAESFTAPVAALLETMRAGGWIARLGALTNAVDEYEYLVDLYREVFGIEPPKGAGAGDDGDDGDGEGEGKGKGRGKADEGEAADGDGEGKGKPGEFDYLDWLEDPHNEDESTREGVADRIRYDRWTHAGGYNPHTVETMKIGTPDQLWSEVDRWVSISELESAIDRANVRSLAGRARRYLQANTRSRVQRNLRKGKLDTRKLSKVLTAGDNPPVFSRKTEALRINTAVSILVDFSGSMLGPKFNVACAAAAGMAEVCHALHIPFEVAGFTEPSKKICCHVILKDWHEPWSTDRYLDRCSWSSGRLVNNADGDNILVAYHRLMRRQEKKRLLLVMSDGSPAAYRGDAYGHTLKVVGEIEKSSPIEILGVGIMDTNVRNIYTNSVVVDSLKALPEQLIGILAKTVTL